jgi:hypothetical protein
MTRVANRQNFMQARVLLPNHMLNPKSGIKLVRHTAMDPENARKYENRGRHGVRDGPGAVRRRLTDRRAAVISTLFVVAHTGISVPVIGGGVPAGPIGLEDAGLVFISCMAVLVSTAAAHLLRRPVPARP